MLESLHSDATYFPKMVTNDYATHDYEQHGESIKITDTIGLEGSKGNIKVCIWYFMKLSGRIALCAGDLPPPTQY